MPVASPPPAGWHAEPRSTADWQVPPVPAGPAHRPRTAAAGDSGHGRPDQAMAAAAASPAGPDRTAAGPAPARPAPAASSPSRAVPSPGRLAASPGPVVPSPGLAGPRSADTEVADGAALDRLAQRLYGRLRGHLAAELLADRERAQLLTDLYPAPR